jgi:hypothetical protein
MILLQLTFKCPHCDSLNYNANEIGTVALTISRNTGDQYPQQDKEPVTFMCAFCSQITAWEVDLKLL